MDNKRRPVRGSALRAQEVWTTGNASGYSSAEDEEGNKPAPRMAARRNTKVDLSRLEASSLQKYRRFYKLGDAPANTSKDDLVPSVARHFAAQVVDEDDVLMRFVQAVQRHVKTAKPSAPLKPMPQPMKVNSAPVPKPRK
mmetsp:Transcript_25254/g.54887  ORF Transcript_25254/g.54887 Transcript_25254/m.54887 type:complete len:140 (-) Transcript_25254:659-1078(-)|eukprot:CAMPEP_0202900398 /NCGR_PEP_ID=MMETSP1392-20130828/11468_1 /ASSEMBLY_ACC=CAM_ASM_000868 /TAXON_ID=225041 /ORGANISM="Chlamydomonas chlamydogama, Strain SAG 11-48b" /LENGTH=139 /DNA_ID=CAMNT_0049586779 /DNA_START=218 /DNA_END=637 /DNA_ORIENTATION=+